MRIHMISLAFFLGCKGTPVDTAATDVASCDSAEGQRVGVITTFMFARADDNGVSEGFDLDGVVTGDGDSSGCGVTDYTSPEGVEGIDNAFARLIPAMELTEAAAVESIVEELIKSGELLLMIELESVEDPVEDPCVDFTLLRGAGEPLLSPDREVLAGQTFDRDPEAPWSRVEDVVLDGGRVDARPFTFELPFNIFDYTIDFELTDAAARANLGEDGVITGLIGGGTEIAYIMEVANFDNVNPEVALALEYLLEVNADIDADGDGVCERISVAFEYSAVSAYFFEDSPVL